MNAVVKLTERRVQRIADDLGCTVEAVHAMLDAHPLTVDRDVYLRRTLALDLLRLDELEEAFRRAALDGDVASGTLLVKICERRCTLLGLNPSPGFAVAVVQPEPSAAQSST